MSTSTSIRQTGKKTSLAKSQTIAKKAGRLPIRKKAPAQQETRKTILGRPSHDYARALVDPFDGPLASIPDFPSTPSRRVRVYTRGFATSGTNQIGFVCADPYSAKANDLPSVTFSDSTYTGNSFSIAGIGVNTASTNSDYVEADFGTGTLIRGRIVAAGLRVRFSSTEFNRGGVAVGLVTPNHNALNGMAFQVADTYECSRRFRPQQGWMTVLYCPVYDIEMQYTAHFGSPTGSPNTNFPIMGFIFQAPDASTAVSYEYEFYEVYEVQGINTRGLEPSFSDPSGFAAVQTAAQLNMMAPFAKTKETATSSFLNTVEDVAKKTLTGIAINAIPMVAGLL